MGSLNLQSDHMNKLNLTEDQLQVLLNGTPSQYFAAFGVTVIKPILKGQAKDKFEMVCQRCNTHWFTTPAAKRMSIKHLINKGKLQPGEYAGCPECNRDIVDDNKRSASDVIEILRAAGYEITDDYVNATTRCTLIDRCGNKVSRIPGPIVQSYKHRMGKLNDLQSNGLDIDELDELNEMMSRL